MGIRPLLIPIPLGVPVRSWYSISNDRSPDTLDSFTKLSIIKSTRSRSLCSSGRSFNAIYAVPFSCRRTPVVISALRIKDTSWPDPVSPKLIWSGVVNNPFNNLVRLFMATVVKWFLFKTSLLITGVLEYTWSQISESRWLRCALRYNAFSWPL